MKSLKLALLGSVLVIASPAFAAPCGPNAAGSGNVTTASAAAPQGNGSVATASAAAPQGNGNVTTASAASDCK